MQKGQTGILIIVGILVLAGVAYGAYFLGRAGKVDPSITQSVPQTVKFQPTPSPAKVAVEEKEEISNWKTYTHPQLKFTLKLPDTIVPIREHPDSVTFVRKEESDLMRNNFTISIFIATRNGSAPEEAVKSETCGGCTVTTEKAQINNAIGLRTTSGFASQDNYYLIDSFGKGPVLRIYLSPNYNYPDYDDFKKILSTFKFIK